MQDVTPEYIRDIRALGLKPSANELIALRVQDVTPEYIKALQSAYAKFPLKFTAGAESDNGRIEIAGTGKGDVLARVRIEVPKRVSKKERELLEQLKQVSG